MSDETPQRNYRKIREGVVTSDRRDQTVIVSVSDRVKHPMYGKYITRTRKLHAHNADNDAGMGDRVRVMETRPLSKTKRWRILEIVERAK